MTQIRLKQAGQEGDRRTRVDKVSNNYNNNNKGNNNKDNNNKDNNNNKGNNNNEDKDNNDNKDNDNEDNDNRIISRTFLDHLVWFHLRVSLMKYNIIYMS